MIEFIKDNINDISYWLMFLAMVVLISFCTTKGKRTEG